MVDDDYQQANGKWRAIFVDSDPYQVSKVRKESEWLGIDGDKVIRADGESGGLYSEGYYNLKSDIMNILRKSLEQCDRA